MVLVCKFLKLLFVTPDCWMVCVQLIVCNLTYVFICVLTTLIRKQNNAVTQEAPPLYAF